MLVPFLPGFSKSDFELAGLDLCDHRLAYARPPRKRSLSQPSALSQIRDLVFDQNLSQFVFHLAPQAEFVYLSFEQSQPRISRTHFRASFNLTRIRRSTFRGVSSRFFTYPPRRTAGQRGKTPRHVRTLGPPPPESE